MIKRSQTAVGPAPDRAARKPASLRRQDIVAAALELVRHHGVERVTTRSLARAAGIAQATLFLHFGNKTQVLLAVIDAIQEELQRGLGELDFAALCPTERLRTIAHFHLGFIERQPGIPRLLFSEELQSANPALRERMQALMAFFAAFLSRQIRDGQRRGELRAEVDADSAARLLIAAVQGLAFRWILSGQGFVLRDQARLVSDTFLEGWRVGPPPSV
ncbi:MAG: TetR/AcrR family transcriptional regulator [Gammaproteobacteria bacterium]|nr:TetR/AcrR family transcriptional regulator [Gammaproteobacteria bacterium]NIR97898.1 TetR/AcrR family transcriptional regulator [Gammaproteobacteria bacterium]NIT63603.1 TetR/AcrR family transcriptional regulator [Gammaproteobacteria bacterium]NIV20539.1 TetR family transcriptional regulator [Gammaproteobacteria bacterium]NIX11133.1 TetR family transcriptional regulator [Gammaproteobacteria bacterium]